MTTFLSVCLFVCQSVCQPACLSACLSMKVREECKKIKKYCKYASFEKAKKIKEKKHTICCLWVKDKEGECGGGGWESVCERDKGEESGRKRERERVERRREGERNKSHLPHLLKKNIRDPNPAWCRDTHHNNTQYNGTQNDSKKLHSALQHWGFSANVLFWVPFLYWYADCRCADCCFAECRGVMCPKLCHHYGSNLSM